MIKCLVIGNEVVRSGQVLFGLAVLMILMKKRPASSQRPPLLEAPQPRGVPAYEQQTAALPAGTEAVLPPPQPALQQIPALPDAVDGKEKVVQLINAYPDRAVEVLRLWLHEK